MKKILSLVLIMIIFIQTRCYEEEKIELDDIINTVVKEEKYTSASYKEYLQAVEKAIEVKKKACSSYNEIEEAKNDLKDAINKLKLATSGVYEITYTFTLLLNDNIGNDWREYINYDNRLLNNGHIITKKFGEKSFFKCQIIEYDAVLDIGEGKINICFENEEKSSEKTTIIVRENKGRFVGNIAKWEVNITSTLKERK